jgi:two-component system cell cycle response regulator
MKSGFRVFSAPLWSRPDPVLAEAGIAGELFVAKIRIVLAAVLLLIPAIDILIFSADAKENLVGLGLTSGIFIIAIIVYWLVSRDHNPPWLSFATSSFDVTLVSSALAVFFFLDQPHTAVNSKVIFEGYFLAISGTSLRYDKRVCISAGLLAVSEYLAIVFFASRHWDLNNSIYAPYPYGMFSWSAQISRLIILITASALSISLVMRSQKLLQLATTDVLTGLFNRALVDERLSVELSRAHRYNKPLTIAVIDVDLFKALNDAHGHVAGDHVLRNIGTMLRTSFRESDTAGRYGGEEFIVILPETRIEAARQKLESLRKLMAETPFSLPARNCQAQVTISAGLASFPHDGKTAGDLFAAADERMFQAKREGRNRIVAGPVPIEVPLPAPLHPEI